jgi:hypothetical protein
MYQNDRLPVLSSRSLSLAPETLLHCLIALQASMLMLASLFTTNFPYAHPLASSVASLSTLQQTAQL